MATLMLAAAVPGVLGMQSMEPQVRVLILEAESLPLAAQQQPLVLRIGGQRLALAAGGSQFQRCLQVLTLAERMFSRKESNSIAVGFVPPAQRRTGFQVPPAASAGPLRKTFATRPHAATPQNTGEANNP